jgi:polar amino acid transport system ATP-binding protein
MNNLSDLYSQESDNPVVVQAEKVNKYFGTLHVLKDISMQVRKNEVVIVIGPSGSGKSTLLRSINHLEKINSGHIYVNGRMIGYKEVNGRLVEESEANIARHRAEIGMVFQRFNLFPHLTVVENIIEAPVNVKKIPVDQATEDAARLLSRVGLSDKSNKYPNQLSGGQQQRVAIARALVTHPSLLLADEPTGNLDSRTSVEIMAIFQDLRAKGNTIVLVTHEHDIALYTQRIVEMRDGRIIRDEPVAEPLDARAALAAWPSEPGQAA